MLTTLCHAKLRTHAIGPEDVLAGGGRMAGRELGSGCGWPPIVSFSSSVDRAIRPRSRKISYQFIAVITAKQGQTTRRNFERALIDALIFLIHHPTSSGFGVID